MIRQFKGIDVEAEVCGVVLPVRWTEGEQQLTIRRVATFAEAAAIIDALGRATTIVGFRGADIIPKTNGEMPIRVGSASFKDANPERVVESFNKTAEESAGDQRRAPKPAQAAQPEPPSPSTGQPEPPAPAKIGRDPALDRAAVQAAAAEAPAAQDDGVFRAMQSMKEVVQALVSRGAKNLDEVQVQVQDLHAKGLCPMLARIPDLPNRIVSTCTILGVPGTA